MFDEGKQIVSLLVTNDNCCKNNNKFNIFLERGTAIFMERLKQQETYQPWQPAIITLYYNAYLGRKYGKDIDK